MNWGRFCIAMAVQAIVMCHTRCETSGGRTRGEVVTLGRSRCYTVAGPTFVRHKSAATVRQHRVKLA